VADEEEDELMTVQRKKPTKRGPKLTVKQQAQRLQEKSTAHDRKDVKITLKDLPWTQELSS
jgi:hypothetical protein